MVASRAGWDGSGMIQRPPDPSEDARRQAPEPRTHVPGAVDGHRFVVPAVREVPARPAADDGGW